MPPAEFEPTVSPSERSQNYPLDREAAGTGKRLSSSQTVLKNLRKPKAPSTAPTAPIGKHINSGPQLRNLFFYILFNIKFFSTVIPSKLSLLPIFSPQSCTQF